MISSNYKLTYDPGGTPVVLVAVGDRIAQELEFALEKSVEVVGLIDAAAPFVRVGKNAVVTFTIEKATDGSDDKTARAAILDALLAAQSATKKPLKIEVSGITASYWQFTNATIKSHGTRRYLEAPAARWVQTWSITATGLTKVTP
jgi:hypothetical protein